jgi:transcription elongation factor S-II
MSTAVSSSGNNGGSGCEEDVMRIKRKLDKMMKANEIDVNTSIDMLNCLKKLPIDLQILKNTGIGVALNNLRKNCNSEELGTLAKALLKNWKRLVSSESQQQLNTNVSSPNSNSNDSSSKQMSPTNSFNSGQPSSQPSSQSNLVNFPNSLSSNGKQSSSSLKRQLSESPERESYAPNLSQISGSKNGLIPAANSSSMKIEEKNQPNSGTSNGKQTTNTMNSYTNTNAAGDSAKRKNPYARHISYTETKDPVRMKCREMLANALELTEVIENGAALCDAVELASKCEDIIFAEFKNTDVKYKNRVRSRVINLKDSKNPKLRESVRLGIISPERLAVMASEEMASDELKELRAKFTKEAIDDHQMARTQGAKTSLLKCSKCKKNNVSYSEMQTRSADEPMTTFAYCLECGHRWKVRKNFVKFNSYFNRQYCNIFFSSHFINIVWLADFNLSMILK